MNEKLLSINYYDKLNASVLGLVTSEMPRLNEARKQNGYSDLPTFEEPFPMPFKYITLNGIKIRMAKSISGIDKPTIVLLSPFPHSIMAFAPIWKLLKMNYNLYAYDMPGFGRSETDPTFMSFKFQGEFLKDFLTHFDIEDSHLVGPDVGMPSILYYVGTFKNKVKSIIVGDGPAINPSSNASVIRKMVGSGFWRLVFKVAGSGALVEAGKRICYVNYIPNKYEMSDYKYSYKGKVADTMKWFKDYPKSLATVDPLLENINTPTKIFWGEEDAILYKDNGERLHKRMPNSDLEIFKNCGHFAYQDNYQRFGEMVGEWVNKHS
jgi:pimeloyl-ACP methyl ester carboxylesterase